VLPLLMGNDVPGLCDIEREYIHICIYICIHIYIERERDRERETKRQRQTETETERQRDGQRQTKHGDIQNTPPLKFAQSVALHKSSYNMYFNLTLFNTVFASC
jgi:hypothetical protein